MDSRVEHFTDVWQDSYALEGLLEQSVNTMIKRLVIAWFVMSPLVVIGTGCNTARSFGKDVEKTGEKIQKNVK